MSKVLNKCLNINIRGFNANRFYKIITFLFSKFEEVNLISDSDFEIEF